MYISGDFVNFASFWVSYLVTSFKLFIFTSIWGNIGMKTHLFHKIYVDISEYAEFFLLPEIFRNSNFFDKMQFLQPFKA